MSKKLIMFLSKYTDINGNPKSKHAYKSEIGDIEGIYTNDAPTKYFIEKGIDEILCIVTTDVKSDGSYEKYKKMIEDYCISKSFNTIEPEQIDFEDGKLVETIKKIIENAKKEDEIYIDTTGGFRNVNYMIMMLIRFLEYTGIQCTEVIYSNYNTKKIENVTSLYNTINLINSVQIFTSFGNSVGLSSYFANSKNKKIKETIKTMDKFSETITLCRSDELDNIMLELSNNLNDFDEEKLNLDEDEFFFYSLIETIKEKFHIHKNDELTYLHIINWCLENNLIQQAITFYVEKLPKYLIDKNYIEFSDEIKKSCDKTSNFDMEYQLFYGRFMNMANAKCETKIEIDNHIDIIECLKKIIMDEKETILSSKSIEDNIKIKLECIEDIKAKMITALENIIFILNSTFSENKRKAVKEINLNSKEYLKAIIEKNNGKNKEKFLNEIINNKNFLEILYYAIQICDSTEKKEEKKEKKTKIIKQSNIIDDFEKLIKDNQEYRLNNISPENMKQLMRNVLYIKNFVRNRVNHASDEDKFTEEEKNYLKRHGYQVDEIKIDSISKVIKNSIDLITNI